jgi:hypothetical protein
MKAKRRLLLLVLLIVCLGLSEKAHAVSPAPDGGYPGNPDVFPRLWTHIDLERAFTANRVFAE